MYGNIIINSLFRPVTRESIEAFLREFGEKVWDISGGHIIQT